MSLRDPSTPTRVRFPLQFRTLRVAEVQDLTPHMRRIVLEGPELDGFRSEGFDDHVKLFPPLEGRAQTLPRVDENNSPVWAAGTSPVGRDYTPRHYVEGSGQLVLDFATGHGGPATQWAEGAKVGDELGMGGPRGSFIVPTHYGQQLLIGDDTAIPAIMNRLEALPSGVRAVAVIEVEGPDDQQPVDSQAEVEVIWLHRKGQERGTALVTAAVEALNRMEAGELFVWGAAEASVARALRPALLKARPDLDRKLLKVSAYWKLDPDDSLDVPAEG